MSQILVQVDATGVVSDELRNELAGVLAGQDEFGVTVLRGTVLDNAALMGLARDQHGRHARLGTACCGHGDRG